MTGLLVAVAILVLIGSLLAMAEASLTRVSAPRARALVHEGRRNAHLLERIEDDPARYLNSVYLSVMGAQNGSAILVAIVADRTFGSIGITITSVVFTLLYFVFVEAMSKTFAVLHSDRVALRVAPVVVALSTMLSFPVRLLIGLGNVLLPGKGLKEGPFVSVEEIRQLAEAGHEAGSIESQEKELIYSVLELGDVSARDVMVPRPDMRVLPAVSTVGEAAELMAETGHSRIPVYSGEADNITGVVYVKDVIRSLGNDVTLREIARPPYFVPETVRVSDVLREMQRARLQIAIVTDEHGDVAGLLTLEDIVEEIVGDIADEDDIEEPTVLEVGPDRWRVQAKTRIRDFNDLVGAEIPEDEDWQTIGGLVSAALAKIPEAGDQVTVDGYAFRVEHVSGPRIGTVLVERSAVSDS